MPESTTQPTLVDYLYERGIRNVTVTDPAGRPAISWVDFPLISTYLYEIGALIGRARRDRMDDLDRLVAVPGKPHSGVRYAQEKARARLKEFGREPNSFYIFIVSGELLKVGLTLKQAVKVIQKAHDEKLPLEVAGPHMKAYALEGIGFGSCFPELTERMYRAEHVSLDSEVWKEAAEYGLPVPGYWAMIPFEEEEKVALHKAAVYTARYHPDLLDRLDLRGYLAGKHT